MTRIKTILRSVLKITWGSHVAESVVIVTEPSVVVERLVGTIGQVVFQSTCLKSNVRPNETFRTSERG